MDLPRLKFIFPYFLTLFIKINFLLQMSGNFKKIKQETIKVCVRARPLLSHEDVVFWVINSDKNSISTLK